jgi:hypothetical protein
MQLITTQPAKDRRLSANKAPRAIRNSLSLIILLSLLLAPLAQAQTKYKILYHFTSSIDGD